jgi:DNA-binding response OmpR family regulator
MASKPVPLAVRFGTFEVDFEVRELRKRGLRVRLEEKPFQILELLLERPGQVVTRKSLCEKLWPDTHVGYEQSLNTAVNKLRELLGDSPRAPALWRRSRGSVIGSSRRWTHRAAGRGTQQKGCWLCSPSKI